MISLCLPPCGRIWILGPGGQVLHNKMTGWDAYHTHGANIISLCHPVPESHTTWVCWLEADLLIYYYYSLTYEISPLVRVRIRPNCWESSLTKLHDSLLQYDTETNPCCYILKTDDMGARKPAMFKIKWPLVQTSSSELRRGLIASKHPKWPNLSTHFCGFRFSQSWITWLLNQFSGFWCSIVWAHKEIDFTLM